MKTRTIGICSLLLSLVTGMAVATPLYQNFGQFDPYTGGGSGIPNDAVAWSQFSMFSGNLSLDFTLGLTATERYCTDPVGNDGAGTFLAQAGVNDLKCDNSPATAGANWNFGVYFAYDGEMTFAQLNQMFISQAPEQIFGVRLNYDTDPSASNAGYGVLDIWALALLSSPESNVFQMSENLNFNWLATDIPPFVSAPQTAFNPNVAGSYNFNLYAFTMAEDSNGVPNSIAVPLEWVAIDVDVARTAVPEPAGVALFGLGLIGLWLRRRHA